MKMLFAVLLVGTFVSLDTPPQQKRIPFCGFDPEDGYFFEKYAGTEIDAILAKEDHPSGIPQIISEIKKVLKMNKVKINIYIGQDQDNCFATVLNGSNRAIITDVDFLTQVNKKVGTEWAAISIIAHEVGHHIAGFGRNESALDDELDADYWCGLILNRLGADKGASTKCMAYYGKSTDSDSHPNKHRRIAAIEEGWEDSANGEINYRRCDSCGD